MAKNPGSNLLMTLDNYLKVFKKTHLIFDFDETLLELVLPWEDAIKGIKNELIALDKEMYKSYYEKGVSSLSLLQNQYVSRFGKKALNIIIKNEIEFETRNLKGVIPNKKLLEFIKNLPSHKLFIWSSNARPTIEKLLKSYGIFDKFEKIISREDVELLKPEIDGFKLLYDAKIPKKKYLFIGNSDFDKLAAEKVGIDFYLIDFFNVKGK